MKKTRRFTLTSVDEVLSFVSYDTQTITVTLRDYSGPTIKEVKLECCPYIVEEIAAVASKVVAAQQRRLNDMTEALGRAAGGTAH